MLLASGGERTIHRPANASSHSLAGSTDFENENYHQTVGEVFTSMPMEGEGGGGENQPTEFVQQQKGRARSALRRWGTVCDGGTSEAAVR